MAQSRPQFPIPTWTMRTITFSLPTMKSYRSHAWRGCSLPWTDGPPTETELRGELFAPAPVPGLVGGPVTGLLPQVMTRAQKRGADRGPCLTPWLRPGCRSGAVGPWASLDCTVSLDEFELVWLDKAPPPPPAEFSKLGYLPVTPGVPLLPTKERTTKC